MAFDKKWGRDSEVRWPILIILLVGAAVLWALPFFRFVPYDYGRWMLPWWKHIVSIGRIQVFSSPFSNYTPTYLYLLSAATLLDGVLRPLFAIKLLSILGVFWVAYAVWNLLATSRAPRALEGAAWSLFLPTVVINAPVLAQADSFWLAPAMLAVAAAIRSRMRMMVLCAGVALAFKAQALFLAPFVIATLIGRRSSLWLWIVPVLVYCAAMLPAWLLGWPAFDLATVYLRQAQWHPDGGGVFVSNAANLWVVFKLLAPQNAIHSFWIGYLAAAAATFIYCLHFRKFDLSPAATLAAAALSATMLPFLLPGMHERFLALGELLTFCFAWVARERNAIIAAALMQLSLIAAFAGWKLHEEAIAAGGCFFVGAAMVLMAEATKFEQFRRVSQDDRHPEHVA